MTRRAIYDATYRVRRAERIKASARAWVVANPEAEALSAARQRCSNPNDKKYGYYGARGIKCLITKAELMASIGPRPSARYSLDRINNDGNYELGNLRWATVLTQNRNKRQRHG